MSLQLSIDPDDPDPPFEQIRGALERDITRGRLAVGDRLPPVRTLAADLGVAAGTVARAYRELEQAGLIETRGRAGTRVAAVPDQRAGQLRALTATYVERARSLGCADDEVLAAVSAALG